MAAVVDTVNHCVCNNVYCVLPTEIYVHLYMENLIHGSAHFGNSETVVKWLCSEYCVLLGLVVWHLIAHVCLELTRTECSSKFKGFC